MKIKLMKVEKIFAAKISSCTCPPYLFAKLLVQQT